MSTADSELQYSQIQNFSRKFMEPDRYETTFSDKFEIGELRDTAYHGTLNPLPKDLFAMIKKK